MRRHFPWIFGGICLLFLAGCGEEYFSTPQKTLSHYVQNRMMGSRQELEATLNSFRREDREWFEAHYLALCSAAYGKDCPGEGTSTETTVWTDMFEPTGPSVDTVESSDIDEKKGHAWLTVEGQDIEFVKERGNWKMVAFFGTIEDLEKKYPQIRR